MNVNHLCMGCMREKPAIHVKCPYCGYDDTVENNKAGQLPIWTVIHNSYMIGKSLGAGGFGITYIGFDMNLQKRIAVKEFFPSGYAVRGNDGFTVFPNSSQSQYFFESEKNRFVEEARILAQIEEQSGVVKVISYVVENNTAYILMEFIEGTSMKQYMRQKNSALSVEETLGIMQPVVKALAGIHNLGIVHRDISLDNIMITQDGKVKLIDFGAAHSQNSSTELRVYKPHYSPAEQLDVNGILGTYSDIYALCVCIYTAITGRYPEDASKRYANDTILKPSQFGIVISPLVEAALMKGLEYQAKDRIKNATDLYYFLYVYGGQPLATIEGMEKKIHDSSTEVIVEKMRSEQIKEKYKKRNLILIFGILGLGILLMGTNIALKALGTKTQEDSIERTNIDIEECIDDFYDLAEENYSYQTAFFIEADYETAAAICLEECLSVTYQSAVERNQEISKVVTEKLLECEITEAGWFVLTYSGSFSTEKVYQDACRELEKMNMNLLNAIDLKNCGKLGVSLKEASDGTYYWLFIYSE